MASKKTTAKKSSKFTQDSYQNFTARLGLHTGNQNDASHYGFNPVSRNRLQMEWVYRGSWVAGRVVDCVARDMTREGVGITSSESSEKIAELEKGFAQLKIWSQLCETIKWARLYGGACAFLMIDGQDPSTPLKIETIRKGQFKGLLPMDRWLLNPSLQDLVEDFGPEFGKPKFYQTVPDTMGMPLMTIHHSRMIRIEGVVLPYWQKIAENLWGQSVLERMWDRLLAYDSTTTGVAQLVYKAHLRTLSVEGLREAIAMGGQAMNGILAQVNQIRAFQSIEGLTLLDATDKFDTHHYTFSGLDAVLIQFGEQLCGAVEIPAVRLFGQSPAGFNSGDNDLRSYYDSIKQNQVADLGPGIEKLYQIGYANQFGTSLPKVFDLEFEHLWQMSEEQKAQVSNTTTDAVNKAYESQIIDRATAMRALQELSRTTGTFQIDDAKVKEAEADPAPTPEALGLELPEKEPSEKAPLTLDSQFKESEHPRDSDGQFKNKGGAAAWKKVGEQKGSNPGGVYELDGKKYYVKFYDNPAQGTNEVMAARITELFGIKTTYPEIKEIDGKKAVVSELKDLKKIDWPNAVDSLTPHQRIQLARIYYVAKLTKNWDVLGVDNSNIMMDAKGNLVQMDTGGTFEFRAKGKPKPYGPDISDTNLLNPDETSGKVFHKLFKYPGDTVIGRNIVFQAYNENAGAIKTIFAIDDQGKLAENFKKRIENLQGITSSLEKTEKQEKKFESKSTEKKLRKGDPGYKTIHQRLRETMKAAADAYNGTEASRLVATVIKVPPPPVTPQNRSVVHDYVVSSDSLNASLRANKGIGDYSSYKQQVEVLDKMMSEARDYALPIKVMRGIPNWVTDNLSVGETFVDHGYQSTTFSSAVAKLFSSKNTLLKITLPKGFKFLSVPSFAKAVKDTGNPISHNSEHEAEAILPRGTGFRVNKIEKQDNHRIMHVDAIFSSIQPARDEWKSTKSLKKPSKSE